MNGLQEVLMTLRLRLRGLIVALAISAILGTGMLVSACGTVAGAGQDGAGNIRAWLQY
jgi:predicted small secreted protein